MNRKRVVIAGGGYAGLAAAHRMQKTIAFERTEVILIDRTSYHQNCTALHEVAVGNSAPEDIIYDLKKALDTKKINVLEAEIVDIDIERKFVKTSKGDIRYDILVNGLGFVSETFGIEGMDTNAFHISNIINAESIASHIQGRFKNYAKTPEAERDFADLTIAVGGAGLTGVELLGEIIDALPLWCRRYGIDRRKVRVYCIEAMDRILPMFDDKSVSYVRELMQRHGVEFMLSTAVVGCSETGFLIKLHEEVQELKAATRIWTAGVRGSRLIDKVFPNEAKRGRVLVKPDLHHPSQNDIYLIGDVAAFVGQGEERPYPPTGQIAVQMGFHTAHNVRLQLEGKPTVPFVFKNRGVICSLGRHDAIASLGKGIALKGYPAIKLKRVAETKTDWMISGVKNAIRHTRILK